MKKLYTLGLLILIALSFNACNNSSVKHVTEAITDTCLTVAPFSPTFNQIATYQEVFSGDSIIKDTPSAIVQIYTPLGQNSRVCLESGSAHIVRN